MAFSAHHPRQVERNEDFRRKLATTQEGKGIR